MQNMRSMKLYKTLLLCSFTCILAACQSSQATQIVNLFGSEKLTPYTTATLTPTITPTPVNAPTATPLPTLTPTPYLYTVNGTDTLWTIAARNGITLAELISANPDINPYTLAAGMKIVVPPSSGVSGTPTVPGATAIPVVLDPAYCTPSLTGGLYCFALVENNQKFAVQNLSAQFILTDPETGDHQVQIGLLPLTHLQSGSSLPFFAYFPPPVSASPKVELQLLTALPVNAENDTTLAVNIQDSQTEIAEDGCSAKVKASLALQKTDATANRFWVAAVAYDLRGNIIGIRQLDKQANLGNGQRVDFTLYIYSVAGKIDHVDLFGEAMQEK